MFIGLIIVLLLLIEMFMVEMCLIIFFKELYYLSYKIFIEKYVEMICDIM